MLESQAKRLRKGNKVVLLKTYPETKRIHGIVTKKYYSAIWIKWEDGPEELKYFAEKMPNIYTQDQIEENPL